MILGFQPSGLCPEGATSQLFVTAKLIKPEFEIITKVDTDPRQTINIYRNYMFLT